MLSGDGFRSTGVEGDDTELKPSLADLPVREYSKWPPNCSTEMRDLALIPWVSGAEWSLPRQIAPGQLLTRRILLYFFKTRCQNDENKLRQSDSLCSAEFASLAA